MIKEDRIDLNKRFIQAFKLLEDRGAIVKNDRGGKGVGDVADRVLGNKAYGHIIRAFLNPEANGSLITDKLPPFVVLLTSTRLGCSTASEIRLGLMLRAMHWLENAWPIVEVATFSSPRSGPLQVLHWAREVTRTTPSSPFQAWRVRVW
jgi:hypothetical protein